MVTPKDICSFRQHPLVRLNFIRRAREMRFSQCPFGVEDLDPVVVDNTCFLRVRFAYPNAG
jgi:hypothetical protein